MSPFPIHDGMLMGPASLVQIVTSAVSSGVQQLCRILKT